MATADHTHIRPWRAIDRRSSRQIHVGAVLIGGDAPIAVQSMTNTLTADAAATIGQIRELEEAGADIVRVSCPDEESTAAFREIARAAKVPLVADIHFHYRRAIEAAQAGAACLRINPGNIGSADRVREVVQAARDHGCSMRIAQPFAFAARTTSPTRSDEPMLPGLMRRQAAPASAASSARL